MNMFKEQPVLRADQEIPETPQTQAEPEEQSIKQEEEQLPMPVPTFCVKTVSSQIQQRHTTLREETQGEGISSEPYFHSETEEHPDHLPYTEDDDWEHSFSCSSAQMETEADDGHYNKYNIGDMAEAEKKKEECPFCQKTFGSKQHLQRHIRVHVGERPYSCPLCKKTFTQKNVLDSHLRTHTGERPFSCPVCKKSFAQKGALDYHGRTHTGDRPYSCPLCHKTFTQSSSLNSHRRIHTGEKPFSCSICDKTFNHKSNLRTHMSLHIGDKPFICSFCDKTFTQKAHLKSHLNTHQERPAATQTVSQTSFILFIVNPAPSVNVTNPQGESH